MMSSNFQKFFDRATRVVERALGTTTFSLMSPVVLACPALPCSAHRAPSRSWKVYGRAGIGESGESK
jgi:hypothetical protein